MSKYINAYFFRKNGLSFVKFLVLKTLAGTDEVMTPSRLAESTQTEIHNITTLIARLKKDGLVTTGRSETDKRSVHIFITDEGRIVLNQSMTAAQEIISQVMSSVSEADAVKFSQILDVLWDNTSSGIEKLSGNL